MVINLFDLLFTLVVFALVAGLIVVCVRCFRVTKHKSIILILTGLGLLLLPAVVSFILSMGLIRARINDDEVTMNVVSELYRLFPVGYISLLAGLIWIVEHYRQLFISNQQLMYEPLEDEKSERTT